MIKFLTLTTFIFIILQDCSILIGSQLLYLAPILMIIYLCILYVKNNVKFNKQQFILYKKTPVKYLIWFILFMVLTAFLHGSFQSGINILFRVLLIWGLTVVPSILFAVFTIPQKISFAKTLKIFIISSYFVLLYGVFDYFCRVVLTTKPPLYNILCSRNYFSHIRGLAVNTTGELLERASSIFFEPSFFATFIFLFLPLSYVLFKSKTCFFKNKKTDLSFKFSLIILFWTCLFFTKSPVYIILCIVYTSVYFAKDIFRIIKKHHISTTVITFLFIGFFISYEVFFSPHSEQYNIIFNRITKVYEAGSLDSLVKKEASFATRIISTINTYQAFKKVPIIGCGYGNTTDIMYQQYSTTKTPLTKEIIIGVFKNNASGASPNIFWSMLLQTGVIGTGILYLFFIKTIALANKIKNFYTDKPRILLDSIISVAINYTVISFYWSLDNYPMMWFIFGILNSFILTYKTQIKKQILTRRDL